MGSNEGRVWVSLGGVVHVELSEGCFGLTCLNYLLLKFIKFPSSIWVELLPIYAFQLMLGRDSKECHLYNNS